MNQRSITEGLSRLVRIPALHAGGHGFKSHPLHAVHGIIHTFYKCEDRVLRLINGSKQCEHSES